MDRAPAPSLTAWRRVPACEQVCRVDAETLLLDVARAQAADIIKTLKRYKLRAKVVIEDRSQELSIYATLGPSAHKLWVSLSEGGTESVAARGAAMAVFQDPRLIDLGVRVIAPAQEAFLDMYNTMLAGTHSQQTNDAAAAACAHVSEAAFDMYRLSCGVAQVADARTSVVVFCHLSCCVWPFILPLVQGSVASSIRLVLLSLSLPSSSPSQTCWARTHTGSRGAAVGRVHTAGEQSRAFWGCQLC